MRINYCLSLIMLIAITNRGAPVLDTDGDNAFWKVNNRVPAHELPEQTLAEAVNLRLDVGKPGPRYGVMLSPWGKVFSNLIPAGTIFQESPSHAFPTAVEVDGFVVGKTYVYVGGNSFVLSTAQNIASQPGGTLIYPGSYFVAKQVSYLLWGAAVMNGRRVTAAIYPKVNSRCYGRFSDPNGFDNAVLVTDELRSDGGIGRAWRICPNNGPEEISLNGHDVWGPAQVVQCYNGLLLLRDGAERHYFAISAVGTNVIQLNCLPAFADGDEVQIIGAVDGSAILGTSAPNLGAPYFVKNVSGNKISLYDTRAHAVAGGGTGKLVFNTGTGSFYVERISTQAGFYGNGAPVLILQGTDTQSPFEVGFVSAPTFAAVTNTNNSTMIVTAPNHRLVPGDAVLLTGITGATVGTPYFARPLSNDLFTLYTTDLSALVGDATNLVSLSTSNQTGTVTKANAGGQPIAPARLGISFLQRSILVNQRCNLLISDPNDPLHSTPMQATLNANLGENDSIIALMTMPYDTLIIVKSNNTVLSLSNLSQPNTSWVLQEITREYGGVASLATANVGSDRWFLSRRGVASIAQTELGQLQGVAQPKSDDILQRFQQNVDWLHAAQACASEWNNRVFFSVPLKGQVLTAGTPPTNNGTFVYNTVNQGWEDLWQGPAAPAANNLQPFAFSRLTVNGEERLTFATADGLVCWFTDDFQDTDATGIMTPIATKMVTRGYFKGVPVLTLKGEVNWDTFNANLTVSVRTAGVNEQTTVLQRTYDKTQYQVANAGTYDPNTSTEETFAAPHRADYSPDAGELLVATLNTFQNTTEPLRMRVRDRVPQVVIENNQGAVMVNSVVLAAKSVQTIGQTT